ncbi:MBL fold metallo-hydrolase [Paenibacillus sp. NEAU-GSW1]|uniref:MBL fold metallo-hydrolase n=1 Tax=Paenibacillus sp. NEAU-GSW1 TaxID=2682486 RepID=UPI0012E3180C|nr:MBL fold metallo-hydrolase [Paenibacillus sp. NEAU-GSW1]MUT66979.1 MBL fold metallo-hydrolase [Paenibacillus sp. NEAU-GSW1]
MNIQKLTWAGVRLESGGSSIAIDPLFHFPAKFGKPNEEMLPLDTFGTVDAVFITHHHDDHFDPEAIKQFYGDVPVYAPTAALPIMGERGLKQLIGVELGETIEVGQLKVTAAQSVDGFGAPQVSWVVDGEGMKALHCGDTLWHGYWWTIRRQHGPFDAVCLPVNSAVITIPGLKTSSIPATLAPEQAVVAATLLDASYLIPIHYGTIHNPPAYIQTPDLIERLESSAHGNVELSLLKPGESLLLAGAKK